ncbi:hypothetical protein H7F37_04365 [Winogradskyella sp. PAMC22761]|nr:hypothetical protein H7F37_03630 [Winogradskyella sp. PAMC22761]QNK78326.1 hypothetical protein H7F37_04365 [Winogradskyella sp. PAMC22761]
MGNIKLLSLLILILTSCQFKAQESNSNKMIRIEFQTIEKKSNDIIIASLTEVLSNNKRIGIAHGDYDGISIINICSNKIIDEQITLKVYGIKCKLVEVKYNINQDSKMTINLEYGQTKYQTLNDRKLILSELNIPICDIEINELEDETELYQHCDGRIKKKNEISRNELSEWERIKN